MSVDLTEHDRFRGTRVLPWQGLREGLFAGTQVTHQEAFCMTKRVLVFVALVLSALGVAAAPAVAQYGKHPSVTCPATAHPGDTITANATGFDAGVTVTWSFDGTVVGTSTSDASGNATLTFKVPATATAGVSQCGVSGVSDGKVQVASTNITIETNATTTVAPTTVPINNGGGSLPTTGSNTRPLLAGAALLIVTGGLVLLATRGRRSQAARS
jgi:hypothetical protein